MRPTPSERAALENSNEVRQYDIDPSCQAHYDDDNVVTSYTYIYIDTYVNVHIYICTVAGENHVSDAR